MAAERCNDQVYKENPDMIKYDRAYQDQLMPYIQGDVLDVGCGAGTFVREYIKKDEVKSVLAIDKYIDEMPVHEKITSIKWDLPLKFFNDNKFDTIVATEFIEHIKREDLEPLLEIVKKHLKPTGFFVGSTPNKVAPTTNPFHLYEYTLPELGGILKNYFSEVEIWDNGKYCSLWKAKI
jgi:2-polyprenyl-3-methyl-5-hydroxy-6-metoxy-1,4-benzoquinol methylase